MVETKKSEDRELYNKIISDFYGLQEQSKTIKDPEKKQEVQQLLSKLIRVWQED